MGARSRARAWSVLLEVVDESGTSELPVEDFRRLVAAWPAPVPATLYSPSRYALQVMVRADDGRRALDVAVSTWKDALDRIGLPEWDVVRVEVLTAEELEHEWNVSDGRSEGPVWPPRPTPAPAERRTADELLRCAFHDEVSGLPERAIFLDEVRRIVSTPVVGHTVLAMVAISLDARPPSDSSPSPAPSDALLLDVATRLVSAVRQGDPVARTGPAQLAALMTLPAFDHAERLGDRVVRIVRAARGNQRSWLPASVGVAASSFGGDPEDLMALAELAMEAARADGGECPVRVVENLAP